MGSNFLGNVGVPSGRSAIISTSELMTREGIEPQRGMNFRDEKDHLSVFLVLSRENGFKDAWDEKAGVYSYEGHDSTLMSGKSANQLMAYESGLLTENGKFFKAARAFKDGMRKEPLQVQVYEKLDAGVWYDKGIFNLVDARHAPEGGRKVFTFYLTLADAEFYTADDVDRVERMLPASTKVEVWRKDGGRCRECAVEQGLRFVSVSGAGLQLRCDMHGAGRGGGLLG